MLAAVIEFLALRVLAGSLGIVVAWDAGFGCVSPLGLWGSWLRGRRGTWEAWDVGGVGRGRRGSYNFLCTSFPSKIQVTYIYCLHLVVITV